MCPAGDEVAVVCNSIWMGRWSELIAMCVCYLDEVIRETEANGELGSAFPGSLFGNAD